MRITPKSIQFRTKDRRDRNQIGTTLKQIALDAGVSQPLVTRALSGRPGVSPETRQRILDSAARLNYDPASNRAARDMAARRHGTSRRNNILALMVSEPLSATSKDANFVHDHPFFLPFFNGVELEANQRGYDVFVCTLRESGLPNLVRNGGVDGVIGLNVPQVAAELSDVSCPLLALGDALPSTPMLSLDHAGGIRQAVDHLVQLGHRDIAYLGLSQDFTIAREREIAFRESMRSHALPCPPQLMRLDLTDTKRASGARAMAELTSQPTPFSAVVCYNDWLAMGAVDYLLSHNFKVPQDVAVVGFDDLSVHAEFQPAITSVAYDREAIGRKAVTRLLELIDCPSSPTVSERFPVHLVRRETS